MRDWAGGKLDAEPHDTVLGAVAAGADIVLAEEAVARGLAFIALLPEPPERFLERSVRRFGASWVPRAQALLEAAARIEVLFPFLPRREHPDYVVAGACGLGRIRARAARYGGQARGLFVLGEAEAGAVTRGLAALWTTHLDGAPVCLGAPLGDAAPPPLPTVLFTSDAQEEALRFDDPAVALAAGLEAGGTAFLDVEAAPNRFLAADQGPTPEAPGLYASSAFVDLLCLTDFEAGAAARSVGQLRTERRDGPCHAYRLG